MIPQYSRHSTFSAQGPQKSCYAHDVNAIVSVDGAESQSSTKQGRTQRYSHLADSMLWLHRVLVAQRDLILTEFRRLHYRLWRLVLPLHRGPGVHQQLYQSFHLRRKVSRVPARRQTSDIDRTI